MKKASAAKIKKPLTRVVVQCTDANQQVKGTILSKTDQQLVVDLPSGFVMTLARPSRTKPYAYRVGLLEFVSDGWPVA